MYVRSNENLTAVSLFFNSDSEIPKDFVTLCLILSHYLALLQLNKTDISNFPSRSQNFENFTKPNEHIFKSPSHWEFSLCL